MPVAKSIVGSFSIISHSDVVKMSISMDKATMKTPELMIEHLTKDLDDILGGKEWRKYCETRGIR